MIELIAMPSSVPGETSTMRSDACPILLVVDELRQILGGGERIVLQLASSLTRYGYQPGILTFSLDPESAALRVPPCPIYLLPLQRPFDIKAVRAALEFRAFLRQQKIRIVHTFFATSDIWAGFITKITSNANLIWSRRDMGFLRTRKQRIAYRLMARFPDRVLAVSERVRLHAIDVDGVNPERVETIYNGVNLEDWPSPSRPQRKPGEFLIVTVGNIRRVKGQDLFVRAAATVVRQFPETRFLIVGEVLEKEYVNELRRLVDELGLTKYLRFEAGQTDLRQQLTEADIFVLPSRSEGFSNAIIEAMASSLPVVATDVGGNSEAVADGASGFIAPPNDAEALADAVISLLSDPARARAMGLSGRKTVEEKFSMEMMVKQVARAYTRLLHD